MKFLFSTLWIVFLISYQTNSQVYFEVDGNSKGKAISTDLIGAFFEDINYAADGGLYAELIQNRSFEYYPVAGYTNMQPLDAWSLKTEGGAEASLAVEDQNPINDKNPHYLKFKVNKPGTITGFMNSGFDGIALKQNEKYDFSVYLRCEGSFTEPVYVQLLTTNSAVIGTFIINNISAEWQKLEGVITSMATVPDARLLIKTKGTGTLYFDMVSLFPQNTFKNRKNGLRKDLAQAIADLNPRFLRFPGGCVSHGRGNDNAYRWKATVGDVAEREANWNLWGYHQSYGLGFYEYFLFAEDMGAMPFPVLPLGVSCQFRNREIIPMSEMQPWVDDALDLIEFANGSADTEWGKVRADMGHPEPFNMEYILLGNEEDDIPEFRERFLLIANAIRAKHPDIKIIGTSGTDDAGGYYNSLWEFSREEDLDAVDEHYYNSPSWFLNNNHRYDDFPRNGPKVFIGEYASRDDLLANAIAEAAYLTGVERNADIIEFTCYAPLLCNENHNQWNPDLIRFNNTNVVKTASYYVQQMYGVYAGDEYIPSKLQTSFSGQQNYSGKSGLGTWNTTAEFDDFKITSGESVLVEDNFSSASGDWNVIDGSYSISDGIYLQSGFQSPALSTNNTIVSAAEYTITVRAKKTGGTEGFLIPFAYQDNNNYYWLNIGGWNNSLHAVEQNINGNKATLASKGGSISNNVWYTIKIDVKADSVNCYLNDEYLFSVPPPPGPVTASVVKNTATNELIIKMVNAASEPLTATLKLDNIDVSEHALVTTLAGPSANVRNTLSDPDRIAPVESTLSISNEFEYILPANSFQVIRVKLGNNTGLNEHKSGETSDNLSITPNPSNGKVAVNYNNNGAFYTVYVYDPNGKLIIEKKTSDASTEILQKDLIAGAYIVKVKDGNKLLNGKLLFQNN